MISNSGERVSSSSKKWVYHSDSIYELDVVGGSNPGNGSVMEDHL